MSGFSISDSFIKNLQRFSTANSKFKIFLEGSPAPTEREIEAIYLKLADAVLDPQCTLQVLKYFKQDILNILSLSINVNDVASFNSENHLVNCIALAKIIALHPDARRFTLKYFEIFPSPFAFNSRNDDNPKRSKKHKEFNVTDLEIVNSCYVFLKFSPEFFRSNWPWSEFIARYLGHRDNMVKWFCCQCIGIITGMNEEQLHNLLNEILSVNVTRDCYINYEVNFKNPSDVLEDNLNKSDDICNRISLSKNVICVSGIYLPVYKFENIKNDTSMVEVVSTKNNLKKVALGIAAAKAINLQGPVGSGKTALVEYLAGKTGRNLGESFIKIQLGDQTDGKMLLGTYRCTDIPGEFVWQPGVLTQAVLDGSWLLLEDIDSASVDIASVLSGLLENRYLTVPGYRDSVPVTPGFQLFVSQRLVTTITGHHKKHTNASNLLEKHVLQINVDPLLASELQDIIQTSYPALKTVCSRMVNVFMLFQRNLTTDNMNIPKCGRLISTRDLFKWCSRAVIDFDVASQSSALKVLQDAIDIFCYSYANVDDRLNLAKEISTHLGIINEKAVYFCNQYKSNLNLSTESFKAGRASIKRLNNHTDKTVKFCFTRPSACLLERIMCCVQSNEPVLLVGETGTGKTSTVQYLAHTIGQKLIVINMNQQSDSADLLGGFKPVDLKFIINPLKRQFENAFRAYFNVEQNKKFLSNIAYCFNEQRYGDLVKLMKKSCLAALTRLSVAVNEKNVKPGKKRKTQDIESNESFKKHCDFLRTWSQIKTKLEKLEQQLKQKNALAFAFIEGSLVKAIENGYWVLLDEINLANAETLECLSGLLEGSKGSLSLLERGDRKPIKRHANFILFACMNPSTDVGKRDLPAGLRNRFTEFFIDELTEKNDLLLLVNSYLEASTLKQNVLEKIVKFYLMVRKEAVLSLSDGLGHKPHFSLRSLCRALTISSKNPCGSSIRNLYEAFCLSFLTQLDFQSYGVVESMINKYIVGNTTELKSILRQPIPIPELLAPDKYLQVEGYWVTKGVFEPVTPQEYVLTESVRRNLKDLVRVVSIGRLPVLLQGDTSIGKTSLITYLAKTSGNKCVRINNHEHTDLQEYIGSYVADLDGKLVFREGLLVEAMRKGHWIILDELNLAPTDVLEALNRVLDDNRELFIPETQETVKADVNFMLFATQNPPGAYGGRKMLSRAFRNRFVELHFNEIPSNELEYILHKRCEMAPSYSKKMIGVMKELQMRRRGSAAFAGKHGFITLRDLFRWGERYRLAQNKTTLYDWDQHIADEGYLVLAGRVRKNEEKEEIAQVIKKYMKREVVPQNLFTLSENTSTVTKHILEKLAQKNKNHGSIVWTYNMRQLAVLVTKAMQFHEPILLVGETGGGKTTICKLMAENNCQDLVTVNCHMHTESSDFIGGLRPVRDHTGDDLNRLFEWVDGPLIQAMVKGSVFLADEISLADDSVLERLNSLLEPERTLLLAEKGTDISNEENSELVTAADNFYFIGTMNPGGDFGKKELSPALRNRFTEIWCESCTARQDLIDIIEHNINIPVSLGNQEDGSSGIGKAIMDFVEWFKSTEIGKRFTISIRDILTWTDFIKACVCKVDLPDVYVHGACLTFLDSFGSGATGMENESVLEKFKIECMGFLRNQLQQLDVHPSENLFENLNVEITEKYFCIKPFSLDMGTDVYENYNFCFEAPTTIYNTIRLLRGLQLNKAILLEGSPGVGKTSLITALAKATRNKIYRVNLSDQTDISDLFGADLPVEGGQGQFSWRDGPLLQALKQGHWILLDELNLASQSVLEGLNACLDHRGEIFIPELGKTFFVRPGTKFFASQNPIRQGGSRRGLPKSFLNRFTQVHVASLDKKDMWHILSKQFSRIPTSVIERMIEFNWKLVAKLQEHTFGYKGGPWEYNLRDMTRWCEATIYHYDQNVAKNKNYAPENFIQLIYSDRMRTYSDKRVVCELFQDVFGAKIGGDAVTAYVTKTDVYFGDGCLKRETDKCNVSVLKQEDACLVLRNQLSVLRDLSYCINLNWMSILVGSAGCGKSSVVHTMAQLVGKTLHTLPVTSAMDTTDLLGGFEQTDYTRHLEEITKQTERLFLGALQELFVAGEKDRSIGLLRKWEKCSNFLRQVTPNKTMKEETDLFLKKSQHLDEILDALNKSATNPDVSQLVAKLKEKARSITQSVKSEGSLNAGGKFEWVDSVFIKCLQSGSWLLIDNVNLCSPAVLDRLNAFLEPNGTLSIGERGVDADGKMVEIKPHKDFRLFLTMDPKNGEISRAMRNRGVEIYILKDTERPSENKLDTKSLINANGLCDSRNIDALLQIHDFIENLVMSEKPNVNHLLQSSFLISQQLQRGISVYEAFTSAVVDVYCKARSTFDFNIVHADSVIKTEMHRILDEVRGATIDLFNCNVTLKTTPLQFNSDLERIKQQMSSLDRCMKNKCDKATLLYLLMHFYSITSLDDLETRYAFIQKYLKSTECSIKNISEELYTHIKRNCKKETKHLPIDDRWLPDTLQDNENLPQSNTTLLALYFASRKLSSEAPEDKVHIQGKNQLTLLQYMDGVLNKRIEEKIDDVVVKELLKLFTAFDKFITNLFNKKALEVTNEQCIEIITFLKWRFVLYESLKVNITNIKSSQFNEMLSNLHVHYKWFIKFSLLQLRSVLNVSDGSDGLMITVNKINSNLINHFSVLKKIGKHYQKAIRSPPPLVNATQVAIFDEFTKIANSFDLYHKASNFEETLTTLCHDDKFVSLLVNVKCEFGYELGETPENFLQLKEIYAKHETNQLKKLMHAEVNLLPVVDYFAVLSILASRRQFNDEFINAVTLPTNLKGVLKRYATTNDERLMHEITSYVTHYLMNCACLLPSRFLNYGQNCNDDKIVLSLHTPVLSHLFTSILVSDDSKRVIAPTLYGNYRTSIDQHRQLNLILWKNMQQLSNVNYDYIFSEQTYLKESFVKFLNDFGESLEINTTNRSIEAIIANIEQLYKNSKIGDVQKDESTLINLLRECHSAVDSLDANVTPTLQLNAIGTSYIALSYLKAILNSKLPLIDPLTKVTLKRKYCHDEINNLECLRTSYRLQNEIFSDNDMTLCPLYGVLTNKISKLHERSVELGQYVAVRPENPSYVNILKDITYGFSTVLTPRKITDMLYNFNESINLINNGILMNKNIDIQSCDHCLKVSTSSMFSIESFIFIVSQHRHFYPDIIEPLLGNITELLYGIKLKISLLRKLILQYNNQKIDVNLHEDLTNYIKFPALDDKQTDYVELVNRYNRASFQDYVATFLATDDEQDLTKHYKFRLFKTGIQEIYNTCIIDAKYSSVLDIELFKFFNDFIKIFVTTWHKQEEERETKAKESESLYKMKQFEPKSEEELIEEEFRSLFPSYHDRDFADMQKQVMKDDEENNRGDRDVDYAGVVTLDDVKFVFDLHSKYLQTFTKSEWLNSKRNLLSCDYVTPLIQKYNVFKLLLQKSVDCLNYTMDSNVLASLSILTHVAESFGDTKLQDDVGSPVRNAAKRRYDFYKDPNVDEIKCSFHVIEELRHYICELLNDWPDHPTLQNINTIIQRIYGFDITSPISRFLTGYEILLSKCHEWEENAHLGVSLQQYTQNLTQQIISWRKLELNMWKDSLTNTFERMNEPVSKWWFYIYRVMEQFEENAFLTLELIETLQKFVNDSNLAEFENRLDLLYTFHCHCVHLPRNEQLNIFMNVLWNLYNYYHQFLPNVANKIKEFRSPIEKKLKDYVKIVRWKDVSYWAIKATLEKSHQTIHKYMREFENVLKQSVLPHLVNVASSKNIENIGIWDRPQRVSPKSYHYTMDSNIYLAKKSLSKKLKKGDNTVKLQGVLSKVEKYFCKSRLLCKDIISSAKYPELIQSLDGFVTEVIESSDHLQKLEVDNTLTKEKQKSRAKAILQQKQRALADLYKKLSKIGLSYKTGVMESKTNDRVLDFVLKPINLDASLGHLSHRRNDEKLLTMWDGCEIYYTKSLRRLDILETALTNPSKDLGMQNIERCKGFSFHLMSTCRDEKSNLIESTRNLYYLRYYTSYFYEFCEESNFVPFDSYKQLKNLLKNICITMEQYKVILGTCPEEVTLGVDLNEIPVLKPESINSIQYKNDPLWTKAMSRLNAVLLNCDKIFLILRKSRSIIPSCERAINLQYMPIFDFETVKNELANVSADMKDITLIFGAIPLSNSLNWLIKEVSNVSASLKESNVQQITNDSTFEKFKKRNAKLVETILYAIQRTYKKYQLYNKPQESVDAPQEETELQDHHMKALIIENLLDDLKNLNIKSILNQVMKVASIMHNLNPNASDCYKTIISHSLPVLEQIILLYEFFITQQVSAFRISCKMSSILFNIFIELSTKGFCVPPEFSDEINSEGQEGKQSSGMGLGDGEGEKDVSDKIESEDQLDDARPSGEEKKTDEDKDCKENEKGIEMSEDFDSKLQDVEKKADDDEESNSDSDANEQMGETETDADQLDQQIWGSDDDEAEDDEGEDEKSEGKGDKGEKEGEQQLAASEGTAKDEEDDREDETLEKEKHNKEINEMEEPEYDDNQIDPYHGDLPEPQEPEPMDLPDDLQLDDGDDKGNEENEGENPFDIDAMKEQIPPKETQLDEQDDPKEEEKENKDDNSSDASDEEGENNDVEKMETDEVDDSEKGLKSTEEEEKQEKDIDNTDQSALDQTQTNQDEVQAMDVDHSESADNVQDNRAKDQKSSQPNDNVVQEDNPDKDGVGQSQMEESKTGHKGQANAEQNSENYKKENEQDKKHKPGESDSKRSLGDVTEPTKKKLKTVDIRDSEQETIDQDEEGQAEKESDMYQHIKEASSRDEQVLDTATKEQVEQQQISKLDEEKVNEEAESSVTLPEVEDDEDIEMTDSVKQKAEKVESEKKKYSDKAQHSEGDVIDEMKDIEIEGDIVQTTYVPRGGESTHHTQYKVFSDTQCTKISIEEMNQLRAEVEQQLSTWNDPPTSIEAEQAWEKISSVTSSLAQDLSEHLRLILEPTQASRLKGDFRTGRRINMRKVIPYIASQFRKDKIWLRRTKPSKREYQIVLAIDDSSSMADNHSKELAFESVALISRALTLLESGQLSILSFGEITEVLHKLSDTFTEKSGSMLLKKFQFSQKKTCIAKLVDFVTEMLNSSPSQTNALNAKLLIIVSDGRGIFSEGESYVQQAVRRAKLSNIFMVFVIIDNPENTSSILDIRMPIFNEGQILRIQSYMDSFPFPFYIILRDINSLPSILSDALRQWFEMVSNGDKQ